MLDRLTSFLAVCTNAGEKLSQSIEKDALGLPTQQNTGVRSP